MSNEERVIRQYAEMYDMEYDDVEYYYNLYHDPDNTIIFVEKLEDYIIERAMRNKSRELENVTK